MVTVHAIFVNTISLLKAQYTEKDMLECFAVLQTGFQCDLTIIKPSLDSLEGRAEHASESIQTIYEESFPNSERRGKLKSTNI